MKLRKLLEDLTGYPQPKKDDHEVSMAITDLISLADRAAELAQHLNNEGVTELEGWVQAKITKAADYINAVYDEHMYSGDEEGSCCGDDYEDEEDEDEEEEEDLDEGKPNPQSTCCGRCGRFHVKGTTCRKPYLTGKSHCRNRPRK